MEGPAPSDRTTAPAADRTGARHFGPRSIRGRLLALAGIWVGAALVAAYFAIAATLEGFVVTRFEAELSAVADALSAASEPGEDALPRLRARPVDPRYSAPLSGWYWQASIAGTPFARSGSLFSETLTVPTGRAAPADPTPDLRGPDGEPLHAIRRTVSVPGLDRAVTILVTAPRAAIDQALGVVRRPLALSLLLLGAGLVLATLLQVGLGLRALRRIETGIADIRAGKAEALPPASARELAAATREINALLEQNRQVIARARDHIGNLAHALKTPLAALANQMPPGEPNARLVARMDKVIGYHLRRARTAGAARILGQRAAVRPVIDDVLIVLRGPITQRDLAIDIDCPDDLSFAGDPHDLEEIVGNLVENAAKWARTEIAVIAKATAPDRLVLRIEDDGPGLADMDRAAALTRGTRLDEAAEGWGLGLAIVSDLTRLHDGALSLERGALGGLAARVELPRPPDDARMARTERGA